MNESLAPPTGVEAEQRPPLRLHAFDALRATAMFLGVVIHAGLVYVPTPGDIGVVLDEKRSAVLFFIMGVIHSFRMQLFFVVGGFFGALLCQRLGPAGFLAHRTRRLLLPFVAGLIFIMPVTLSLVGRRVVNKELLTQVDRIAPGHLWFLEYLFLICVVAFVALKLFPAMARPDKRGWLDRLFVTVVQSRWKPALLAVPVAAWLSLSPIWIEIEGWLPGLTLVPVARVMAYYGSFFLFGWLLYRHAELIRPPGPREWVYLLLAVPAFVLMLVMFIAWDQGGLANPGRWLVKTAGVWLHALASWLWIFAGISFFVRYCAHPRPWVRYLADSSYWVYLVHLPLVVWLQFQAATWEVNAWLKFAFVLFSAMGLLLVSYQLFVRNTFIGVFLNGRKGAR